MIATRLKLAAPDTLQFCWVTDFPVFEWDEVAADLIADAQAGFLRRGIFTDRGYEPAAIGVVAENAEWLHHPHRLR